MDRLTTDRAGTGQLSAGAAELYEDFFIPALFGQWPPRLLDLADVGAGQTVLDIGCGTGVLARAARARTGGRGTVIGVDPNPGMLTVAARAVPDIRWIDGRAERLPLDEDSVDRVLSQFALMFFTDPEQAVAEMSRVLRPGGRLVVATWAEVGASPGYRAMVDLLRRVAGDEPADALMAPFAIGTEQALRKILEPGFPDLTTGTWDGVARYPSVESWLLTDVKAWALEDLVSDAQLRELLDHAPRALAEFCGQDGRVSFPAPAIVATACQR